MPPATRSDEGRSFDSSARDSAIARLRVESAASCAERVAVSLNRRSLAQTQSEPRGRQSRGRHEDAAVIWRRGWRRQCRQG